MKFAIDLPYGSLIMDHEDALRLVEIIDRAERYETKYRPAEEGGTTHHVSRDVSKSGVTLKHVPEELYRIACLAGAKPD